jgi:hypothetical protein
LREKRRAISTHKFDSEISHVNWSLVMAPS